MAHSAIPQLMFVGDAEAAMRLYVSLFPDSEVTAIERYGAEAGGREGTVQRATFTVAGRAFACIDSEPVHDFTFTPSFSIFVECEDEAELERAFAALSEGGSVLMPLDGYGFSRRFGWVNDRFGVSWQLNLT